MITFEQIQQKLVEAVEKSNMPLSELAKKIDVKKSTLERYLYGHTKPTLYTFAKICGALKLDPNEILCLDKYFKSKNLPPFGQ